MSEQNEDESSHKVPAKKGRANRTTTGCFFSSMLSENSIMSSRWINEKLI
jgi:hypothetical protein